MYCQKYNLLFIHIPKTGGQSITKYFMGFSGVAWEDRRRFHLFNHGDPQHGPPQTAHFTIDEYYKTDFLPDEVIDQAIKFSVVRNPWGRLWSEYNFYWAHLCSWDEFFYHFPNHIYDDYQTGRDALRHIKPQIQFLNDDVQILRFENLSTDFSAFCLQHDLPNCPLPRMNDSGVCDYFDIYNSEQIDIVKEFYAEDIDAFNYQFGS